MKIKKFFLFTLTLLAISTASCSKQEHRKSLIIYKNPNKTTYRIGEKFTLDGIQVHDDFGIPVTDFSSSIKEGYTFSEIGKKEVYITKTNYNKTSFPIEIKADHSLHIKNAPTKTTYYVGEEYSSSGLEVVDEKGNVVNDFESSISDGFVFYTAGTSTVIIQKEDYTSASFDLNILNARNLLIRQMPDKVNYVVGEAFSSSGLVIDDDAGNKNLSYTLSLQDGEILKYKGEIEVIVSVKGYADISFKINVTNNLSSITKPNKNVNIYYINDTHGTFKRNENDKEAGIAYISSYMKYKKSASEENAVVISGGDMLQGGPESNDTRGKIMIEAMNIATFDAMTLGNHEFDWGEEALTEALSLANFPLLSCNTFRNDGISRPEFLKPFTVIKRDDISIGIIGYARGGLGSSITGSIAKNYYFPDPFKYIKEYSTELRLSYNCDIVLSVGHDEGSDVNYYNSYKELTEINTKTSMRYVDGMMFAHDHNRKEGQINGVPYMETGCNGKYIGHMNFSLENNGYLYEIKTSSLDVKSAFDLCKYEDKEVTSLLTKYADVINDPDKVIATFTRSYTKNEFCVLICQAMYWFVNSNKELFDNETVYVSVHNLGGVRVNNVPKGVFTYGNLIEVLPFENPITISKCTQYQINKLIGNTTFCDYFISNNVVYKNGITSMVTISYIAESPQTNQVSYKEYLDFYCRDALVEYINAGYPAVH